MISVHARHGERSDDGNAGSCSLHGRPVCQWGSSVLPGIRRKSWMPAANGKDGAAYDAARINLTGFPKEFEKFGEAARAAVEAFPQSLNLFT